MLQARNWRVSDLMETGDGDAVRAELAAYAALSAELRLPGYSWWVPLWGATLALLDGRIAEGMELSRRAREQGVRAGDANAEVLTAQHRLMQLMIDRRFDEIDPAAIGAGDPVEERATRSPAARAYRFTFAWVHAERGEDELARANLAAAVGDGLGYVGARRELVPRRCSPPPTRQSCSARPGSCASSASCSCRSPTASSSRRAGRATPARWPTCSDGSPWPAATRPRRPRTSPTRRAWMRARARASMCSATTRR